VTNAQHVDSELHNGKTIKVCMDHQVGHVAMHEHLAGLQPNELSGRHATVRTTDPQVARILLFGERMKKFRILRLDPLGPESVLF